jgi:hypothetical protein
LPGNRPGDAAPPMFGGGGPPPIPGILEFGPGPGGNPRCGPFGPIGPLGPGPPAPRCCGGIMPPGICWSNMPGIPIMPCGGADQWQRPRLSSANERTTASRRTRIAVCSKNTHPAHSFSLALFSSFSELTLHLPSTMETQPCNVPLSVVDNHLDSGTNSFDQACLLLLPARPCSMATRGKRMWGRGVGGRYQSGVTAASSRASNPRGSQRRHACMEVVFLLRGETV